MTTGMRRGEILALRWADVSFQEMSISVEQAWKTTTELGKPKWEKTRIEPMPRILAKRLEKIREIARNPLPADLVFCYPGGRRFSVSWWARRFDRMLERMGIDKRRRNLKPHSLRHTYATLLARHKVHRETRMNILGHSQDRTHDGYVHRSVDDLREGADVIDRLFGEN